MEANTSMHSTVTCRFVADYLYSSAVLLGQLILKRRYLLNFITVSQDLLESLAPKGALNRTTIPSPFPSSAWTIEPHTHGLLKSKQRLVPPFGRQVPKAKSQSLITL